MITKIGAFSLLFVLFFPTLHTWFIKRIEASKMLRGHFKTVENLTRLLKVEKAEVSYCIHGTI